MTAMEQTTPRFDNSKMQMSPALQLFGAGREKRIYAIPPYTKVKSLDFEDHPFNSTQDLRDRPSLQCYCYSCTDSLFGESS